MHKTTRALVLREVKYKEADKILTVLTEDEGKQTVCARGVLRKGSKAAAACQLLTFSEMTLFERGGKWYVSEGSAIEQFLGLRQDIATLSLGTYFAELLEAVSDEDSHDVQIMSLGLNALFALSKELYSPEHIKAVFELKLMCLAGYEPSLDYCPVCGEETPKAPVFSTLEGTVFCSSCAAAYGETFPLCEASLAAMRHITRSEPKRAFAFSLESDAERRLAQVCESYVISQLERRFSALDYWRSVK